MTCQFLYDLFSTKLCTSKIAISIRGAKKWNDETWAVQTSAIFLPRTTTRIIDHCPAAHDHFEVRIDYTLDYLPHDVQMTRGEFLVELLDIWESILNSMPEYKRAKDGVSVSAAIDLLKGTYNINELMDLSYLKGAK